MPRETDRNVPYLTILSERIGNGIQVHAGLARYGFGRALCDDRPLREFALPQMQGRERAELVPISVQNEDFLLYRTDAWRHRWAEAFLELNRGCSSCLATLHQIGSEVGYAKPKGLKT